MTEVNAPKKTRLTTIQGVSFVVWDNQNYVVTINGKKVEMIKFYHTAAVSSFRGYRVYIDGVFQGGFKTLRDNVDWVKRLTGLGA